MKPTDLEPGTVVGGDYRVIEPIGVGGMGAVYLVEQLSTSRRRALEVLHPRAAGDAKARERLVREARVGALIASDHVVDVIGAGVEQGGRAWIAMELLEGEDLGAHLRTLRVAPYAGGHEAVAFAVTVQ